MRIAIFSFLFAGLTLLASGQGRVVPLSHNPVQEIHNKKSGRLKITATTQDTISLPFFDDFTTSSIASDTARWMTGSGVYIGNNFAINPPNFNVATFDGLNANGRPYSTTTSASGPADELKSLPLDLSKYRKQDTVYFRFFWQSQGIGEAPDSEKDSLILEFKNRANTWKPVWSSTIDTPRFLLTRLALDSAEYYYKGFQFRFQSYGRLSGAYDIWNIDYVMLDTGVQARDDWSNDLTFAGPPTPYLKNYTAMPIRQFIKNRAGEVASGVSVRLVNLNKYDRGYTFPDSVNVLTAHFNNTRQIIDTLTKASLVLDSAKYNNYYYNTVDIVYTPDPSVIDSTEVPRILKYKFVKDPSSDLFAGEEYDYNDDAPPYIPIISRFNFQVNDSVSGYTNLTDYYAYDDGTAEGAYGINTSYGRVAVKYELNVQDTLTYLSICFPRIQQDLTNEAIILMVWDDINSAAPVYTQNLTIKYPANSLNNFQTIYLDQPVILPPGSFWVGYQQFRDELMYLVGFDKNTDHSDRIFYNVSNAWEPEKQEKGSLMIRPGFKNRYITGTEKPRQVELDADVFPNPTQGELNVVAKISSAHLYDLSGKLLLSHNYDGDLHELHTLDISTLSNGMYLLHLQNGEAKTVRKIVVSR